jgi:hypothetical protein
MLRTRVVGTRVLRAWVLGTRVIRTRVLRTRTLGAILSFLPVGLVAVAFLPGRLITVSGARPR